MFLHQVPHCGWEHRPRFHRLSTVASISWRDSSSKLFSVISEELLPNLPPCICVSHTFWGQGDKSLWKKTNNNSLSPQGLLTGNSLCLAIHIGHSFFFLRIYSKLNFSETLLLLSFKIANLHFPHCKHPQCCLFFPPLELLSSLSVQVFLEADNKTELEAQEISCRYCLWKIKKRGSRSR